MQTKIAILRGINVGGHRKILMADLRQVLENLGLRNVSTYIQSGNVIFKSDKSNAVLENEIENTIKTNFNFDLPVIVRSKDELFSIIENNPFNKDDVDITTLHITFLKSSPNKKETSLLDLNLYKPDQFLISDKTVYLCLEKKYHKSKLSTNFFEKKLNVGATTRNWKTTLKLLGLCEKLN
jgi:uncharacterized protein (DUF1697 family)